ncbi:MAG: hypothetical protein ACHQF0_11665 [Chitinophagales bacterium]
MNFSICIEENLSGCRPCWCRDYNIKFPVFGKRAPSNKVIVAVSGVNSRRSYLAKSFASLPGVEVAYICDVEAKAIQNGLDALKDAAQKPTVVKDHLEFIHCY